MGEVRAKLVAAVLIVAIVLVGAGFALRSKEEPKILKVLNYSEYIDPQVLKMFEDEYGVKIIYDEYEAAEEAWAKLRAGGGGYDVIITAHSYVGLAAKQGLLRPLNKELLPNLKNLDPRVASHPADPEQKYAVPYMWGTTGIAYVGSCVRDPPETWRGFLSPGYLEKYSGRVSLLSEFSEVVMVSMIALGYDPSDRASWNDTVMSQVESLLREIKPYLAGFYGASQYMPALNTSKICLAQAWNGDVLVVQEANPDVYFVNPEDGALLWVDYMVIPRDAKNVELAHKFINFLLRPDIAAMNVKYVWYASSVKKSLLLEVAEASQDNELMDILNNPLVYPSNETKLVPSPVLDEEMSAMVETVRLHVLGTG